MNTHNDNTPLAVIVILLTVLALSFGDALIKKTSAGLVLWQIFVLRSLLALPVLFIMLRARYPAVSLLPHAAAWTALRSLMLTFMWVIYYASLPHIPLSVAAGAFYTLPIFITLFSAFYTGEKIKYSSWLAILLGFGGVLLILKPTAADFNVYALLPLLSAILYALAVILTRTKCRAEHPLVLSTALNVSFIVVGAVFTFTLPLFGIAGDDAATSFLSAGWLPMATNEVIAIILLALLVLVASIGTAFAYQIGRSSVVGTFDFAYVGFAVIWGVTFFGEIPDVITVGGIVLITIAGGLALRA